MGNPIDYNVFIDDMIKEFKRLKDVYGGKIADTDINALSMWDSVSLKYHMTSNLTPAHRAVYGNAYDHVRATFRALTVASFTREDFYKHAMSDMDKQTSLYSEKKKIITKYGETFDKARSPDDMDKFSTVEDLALQRKQTLELDVKKTLGYPDDMSIPKDMIVDLSKKDLK